MRTRRTLSPNDSLLDSLLDTDDDDDSSLAELMARFEPLQPTIAMSVSSPAVPTTAPDVAVSMERAWLEQEEREKERQKKNDVPVKIPEWEGGVFWKRYGNKVRVGQSGLMMYTGRK